MPNAKILCLGKNKKMREPIHDDSDDTSLAARRFGESRPHEPNSPVGCSCELRYLLSTNCRAASRRLASHRLSSIKPEQEGLTSFGGPFVGFYDSCDEVVSHHVASGKVTKGDVFDAFKNAAHALEAGIAVR